MHNLNFNSQRNQYAFVSAKESPWHELGIVVDNTMTTREAMQKGCLDFFVQKESLITEQSGLVCPSTFANVRTDTNQILGIVGNDYSIIQNVDAFSFFDGVVNQKEAIIETAGALGNGEVVWMSAKLNNCYRINGDNSDIQDYVVLINSHDKSYPLMAYITGVRTVCQNTIIMSIRSCKNQFKIKHTQNAKSRFEEAANFLGLYYKYNETAIRVLNTMSDMFVPDFKAKQFYLKTFLSDAELEKFIQHGMDALNPDIVRTIDSAFEYYMSAQDLNPIRGTGFGVYNGLTGFLQHVKEYRNGEDKFKDILLGDGKQLVNKLSFTLVNQ